MENSDLAAQAPITATDTAASWRFWLKVAAQQAKTWWPLTVAPNTRAGCLSSCCDAVNTSIEWRPRRESIFKRAFKHICPELADLCNN